MTLSALSCALASLATLVLFFVTSAKRRRLDLVLLDAAGSHTANVKDVHQVGLFETWPTRNSVALASPERRWTYDQGYMNLFIEALCADHPLNEKSAEWLTYYAGPILRLDIAFAVAFAIFIVSASVLLVDWAGSASWLVRPSVLTAAMGIVYGVADVAEDLKLQRILRRAKDVLTARKSGDADMFETALSDAAEVDAANTLTRVKLVTIALSVVGLCAFLILMFLNTLAIKLVSQVSHDPRSRPPSGKS